MYACLHMSGAKGAQELLDLALQFSPYVEETTAGTLVFSIDPLRKLIGSPYQIASEISRAGYERKLQANLAMASNPDTAILLARWFAGVTLVPLGEEASKLAPIALNVLQMDEAMLAFLHRWGVKTCGELAALPEAGVAERLGASGVYLRKLAYGAIHRPLRLSAAPTSYEEHVALEHPLALLEPLLFLLSSTLTELCRRLVSQSRAARSLALQLDLEAHPTYHAGLEFPVPLDNSRTILKLLQLHLERHSPAAAVVAFRLRVEPVEPRRVQGGIFLPPTPLPDKLQITLARIAGMVGEENVGSPVVLNTHRPDAFEMAPLNVTVLGEPADIQPQPEVLRLAMRLFRPALQARVRLAEFGPRDVVAPGVKGKVLRWAGPWKTSGEWWANSAWSREEWDVALDDGALYRIYQEAQSLEWFVHGVYD